MLRSTTSDPPDLVATKSGVPTTITSVVGEDDFENGARTVRYG